MSFDSLGLSPDILRAVAEQGYREPTPIQQQAIPAVLEGRDLMASAQTGTGKTAGFTLPLLQHLFTRQPHAKGRRPVRALILTPTRELAAQIGENVRDYSKYLNIRSLVVFGGVSINPQMMKLRGGVVCGGWLLRLSALHGRAGGSTLAASAKATGKSSWSESRARNPGVMFFVTAPHILMIHS